ncbi:hypothetical protein Pcinc_028262 [Petrolisthes cinctipes]|uniref:Translational activator of cytochrome c oxidase 1 n=1 Tax=Petrolisthes cinctipes TaxID=88211 RepID=A0AAE1F2Q6_PETCI|nr:hypothetical protein Pcinc_028262 [Petrolisthes cinctipes]
MASLLRVLQFSRSQWEYPNIRGAVLGLSALVSRKNDVGVPAEQVRTMAGHSKWSNIKHIKASNDQARAKTFTKIIQLMRVAIKEGGGTDPKLNLKLARVLEFAQRNSMPLATLKNFLQNYQKSDDKEVLSLVELKGVGGLVMLVEVQTGNFIKTRNSIKSVIKKTNLQEAKGGVVKGLFEEKGVVMTDKTCALEVALDAAITVGAEDVVEEADGLVFTCSPGEMMQVKEGLEEQQYTVTYASTEYLPKFPVSVSDNEMDQVSMIVQKLEGVEDVQY